MPVSGTVARFDLSPTPPPTGPTIVSVSGAVSGTATGAVSTESLPSFFRRAMGILTMSGVLDATSGATSGMQCLSGTVMSGIRNLQQELALRVSDLEEPGDSNVVRLALANNMLTASGEVQFGS